MQPKTRLLCMFTQKNALDLVLEYINCTFKYNNNIFIFNDTERRNDLFCTFTVNQEYDLISRIIIIHRKSETNTLYTINAVNELIKKTNNGQLVHNYPIDWEMYRNQLLLFKHNTLETINYELYDKI